MGRKLLSALVESLPFVCRPEKYGTHEPFTGRFNIDDLDAALESWCAPSFFLASRHSDVLCCIFMVSPSWRNPPHSKITLSFPHSAIQQDEVFRLLLRLSGVVDADFALAHLVTEQELARGRKSGTVIGPSLGVTTHNLRKNVPDLYWLTLFGKPYVDLLGKETLLSAPVAAVHDMGESVALQVSPHLTDMIANPQEFDELRDRCKAHIDRRAFYDHTVPADYQYLVPHFETARE